VTKTYRRREVSLIPHSNIWIAALKIYVWQVTFRGRCQLMISWFSFVGCRSKPNTAILPTVESSRRRTHSYRFDLRARITEWGYDDPVTGAAHLSICEPSHRISFGLEIHIEMKSTAVVINKIWWLSSRFGQTLFLVDSIFCRRR
jgi:hypothetical protein